MSLSFAHQHNMLASTREGLGDATMNFQYADFPNALGLRFAPHQVPISPAQKTSIVNTTRTLSARTSISDTVDTKQVVKSWIKVRDPVHSFSTRGHKLTSTARRLTHMPCSHPNCPKRDHPSSIPCLSPAYQPSGEAPSSQCSAYSFLIKIPYV